MPMLRYQVDLRMDLTIIRPMNKVNIRDPRTRAGRPSDHRAAPETNGI